MSPLATARLDKMELEQKATRGLHEHLFTTLLPSLDRDINILDVGCGTGAWLSRLQGAGFQPDRLCGIDLDEKGFALEEVEFHSFNLNDAIWPPLKHSFRLITAIEVIEHVENVGNFFRGISRMMDPDSTLLVTSPNISSLDARIRYLTTGKLPQFDNKGDPTHIYPVYSTCLERVCGYAGLEVHQKSSYSSPLWRERMYSFPVRVASKLANMILPNSIPGDIAIWLIRRRGGSSGTAY